MKTGIGIGFWEVKYRGVRKDGQVSHLSWGLCHFHIWRGGLGGAGKLLELVTQCPEAG